MNASSSRRSTRLKLLCGISLAGVFAAHAAWAQQRSFDVPSEDAVRAIPEFARQAGLQIIAPAEKLQGVKTARVKGTLDVRAALSDLLAGTGLLVASDEDGVITLRASGRRTGAARSNAESETAAPAQTSGVARPGQVSGSGRTQFAQAEQQALGLDEVVVTGSRIHTTETQTQTPTPVTIISAQTYDDRGFVQAGQLLNELTSIVPSNPASGTSSNPPNYGQTYPNLFNLGAGRTLTLLNGNRMPSTASGLGAESTDTNLFPIGLLEHIDIVQGGGASVYGSGAIAGVVNYILKDHFQGVVVDAQDSISTYGDYPTENARITAGTDFGGGKGNVAADFEWSHTGSLKQSDRPVTNAFPVAVANPAYTGNLTGTIPSTIYIAPTNLWAGTATGVIFAQQNSNGFSSLQQVNGSYVQLTSASGLVNYNPGTFNSTLSGIGVGGDGFPESHLNTLFVGVDRYIANAIGHYDVSDDIKLSMELMAARTNTYDPQSRLVLDTRTGTSAIPFYANNPYLPAATLATLEAASPAFASGNTPLYLGKVLTDVLPADSYTTEVKVYRGRLALDGDVVLADRNFYYTVSYAHAEVDSAPGAWGIISTNLNNATQAVRNSAGQIVCAVNNPVVTVAACVPINIFGTGNVTPAAQQYVTAQTGSGLFTATEPFTNKFDDALATFGGDVTELPAGELKFSASYEHRVESTAYIPDQADQLGTFSSTPGSAGTPPSYGAYHTNEYAAELLAPIVGKDFTLPFVRSLELNGSIRFVDHSIAGHERVWSSGFRWETVKGVTLRGSLGDNFNAPTLSELIAPNTTGGTVVIDPCHKNSISGGTNPAVRAANCLALFTANPNYGITTLPTGLANTPANRLANFVDPSNNSSQDQITSGGNPTLYSETSHTTTFGVVLQPTFLPGLTVTADRVIISIHNALTSFSASTFLSLCLDQPGMPAVYCNTATRDPATGFLLTGKSEEFNAAYVRYTGEVYHADYRFALSALLGGTDKGEMDLTVDATHNTGYWNQNGFVVTESDNTTTLPQWSVNFGARWAQGPWRVNYSLLFRPAEPVNYTDTPVTAAGGIYPIAANVRQNISGEYSWSRYSLRFGINNFTNQLPSYPTFNYGDLIGRQFFAGAKVKF